MKKYFLGLMALVVLFISGCTAAADKKAQQDACQEKTMQHSEVMAKQTLLIMDGKTAEAEKLQEDIDSSQKEVDAVCKDVK